MRSYFAPAIAIAMIMPAILSARSDDIPTLDVNPVCRGIASQSSLEVGLQQIGFEQCVQSEQVVREQLKKEWSTFSPSDKTLAAATMIGAHIELILIVTGALTAIALLQFVAPAPILRMIFGATDEVGLAVAPSPRAGRRTG